MESPPGTDLERLSSSSTTWWSRGFPTSWTLGFGGFVVAAWLDLLGNPPIPDPAKVAFLAIWLVISVVFFTWMRRVQHVWLDGDHLVVGDPRRGVRIPLHDVVEVKESRFQNLKTATLELRHHTPVGKTIVFIPEDGWRWMFPWAPSPTIRDLKERLGLLEAEDRPKELLG